MLPGRFFLPVTPMIKRFFKTLDRAFTLVEEWTLFLSVGVALLVAMANVVLRKLTSDVNLYWSDEIVRKVIFFSTYVGCIAAIRTRALIRIDALPQLFPWLKKPLAVLSHLAVMIFSGLMVWLGGKMTVSAYHDTYLRTASLDIPEWIFYAVLPVMGGMMFLRTLLVLAEDLRGTPEP